MAKTFPAKFYVWGVASFGLGLLTLETTKAPGPEAGLLLCLLVFATVLEFASVSLPGGPTVSMTMGPMVAALMISSPVSASILAVTSSAIHNLVKHGWRSPRWLFNAGQYAISSVMAGRVYSWANEHPNLPALCPLVLYIVAFFLLNYLLVWGLFLCLREVDWRKVLKVARLDIVNYAVAVPSGIGAATVYQRGGLQPFLAVMACTVLAAYFVRESQQVSEKNSIMQILYHVAVIVNRSLDLNRLMDELHNAIHQLVGGEFLALVQYDSIGRQMISVGQRPSDHPIDAVGALRPILERAIAEKRCVVESDSEVKQCRSVLAVPLAHEEQVAGVLVVAHPEPGRYSNEDAQLMTILSSQVAVAFNNALSYRQVAKLAMSDPMTGLYNYRYLTSALAKEMRHADSLGERLSLLYIDLDNFREINNTFGHLAGDSVLREVAGVIRRAVREKDIPCRYGGDEFVIVLPATGREDAKKVLARLQAEFRRKRFQVSDTLAVKISMSIGIATYPDDGITEAELIDAADRAMYLEKGASKEWY
ncbi:MAG TPA: diguanylate cyclase [Firmicutes bacterium]|nr:diguanylate cyclase [Bacillota bacterium]